MIYTITLNPSIDYVVHVNNLELGKLNKIDSDSKLPGGKGINVSRILHRLEIETTALGFVGGFTGNFIESKLSNEGIATDFISINDDTRINIKLKSGKETEINGKGPIISDEEANILLHQLERISDQDIVILSGSKPPSLPNDYYIQLIKYITKSHAKFVIDTTGEDLLAALPYKPLLVKPNTEELEQIFNVELIHKEDIIHYGKKLIEQGASNAIVSMGGDGAILFTKDAIYQGISPKGKVINSVGAGDSMIAGFIGQYQKQHDIVRAFEMGLASGSATAFNQDLAQKENILSLLAQVKVNTIKDDNDEDN